MSNTDKLSAEIQLDIKSFNVAVAGVIRSTETIEVAFDKLSDRLEKNLVAGFAALGKQIEKTNFDKVAKSVDQINEKFKALTFDELASRLEGASQKMQAAIAAVVNPATEFEAALRRVNTIAKLNDDSLVALGEKFSQLGAEIGVGVGPTETLAGAYEILSARSEDAAGTTAILTAALVASSAASVPTAASVDVLTSVLNSYGLAATDATMVSDVLFKTADIGKTTFEQLAPVIGNVAPLASSTGVSIQELGGAIAILTKSGIKTPSAVESIRAVIAALGAPTQEAKKAAAEFGLTLDDSFLKSRGLAGALQEVVTKTGGSASAIRKIIGDVTGFNAALKLTAGNGKEFADAITANFNAAGSSANAAAQRQKTFAAAQERLSAAGERLAVSFGKTVLPVMSKVADVLAAGADAFNELVPDYLKATGLIVGGFVALGLAAAAGLAGVIATGGAIVSTLGGAAAAAATATVAGVTLAEAWVIANASIGSVIVSLTGLTSAGVLAGAAFATFAGLVGGVAIAVAAYTEILKANTKAEEALLAIEERRAKALRDGKDLIGQSAAELRAQGKTAKDLIDVIGGLQDQAEAARKNGNNELVASLNDKIAGLQKVKAELAADPPKIPAPDVAPIHESLKEQKAAAKEQAQALRQRVAEEIAAIKNSKAGDNEKILALQHLIKTEKLRYNEKIHIETLIASLEKKHIADKADAAKKAAEDTFKQELQNVEHSKKGIADQIAQLETLAQKYASNGDKRRKIEDELGKLRDKQTKAELDRIQAIADADAKAADLRKSASEGRTVDLERKQERGADVAEQIAEERRQQGKEEAEAIRKKLEEELSKPENQASDVQVKLENNAKAEIANVNAATERDVQAIQERGAQDRAARAAEEIDTAKRVGDAKLEALQRQQAEGKNVNTLIEQGILEQLKLEEAGINQSAAAAKAATDNANKQKQIEIDAQLQIQAARQKATDQLEEQNRLLDEQKKKQDALKEKGPIQGGSGFAFTLGGISSDVNDRSAFESSGSGDFAARQAKTAGAARRKRNTALTGALTAGEALSTLSTIGTGRRAPTPFVPQQGVLGKFGDFAGFEARRPDVAAALQTGSARTPSLTPKTAKTGVIPGAKDSAVQVQFQKATLDVNVKVNGKEVEKKTTTLTPTTDGRTTPESKTARRMSAKHGNGVRT